ncbi:hypothetical protein bcgnr5372_28220 [Bacillus luti]
MSGSLNRWGNTAQDRDFRNKTNENWDKIESAFNDIDQKGEQAVIVCSTGIPNIIVTNTERSITFKNATTFHSGKRRVSLTSDTIISLDSTKAHYYIFIDITTGAFTILTAIANVASLTVNQLYVATLSFDGAVPSGIKSINISCDYAINGLIASRVGKQSITTENLAKGAVKYDKLYGYSVAGKNLFNKDTVATDYIIDLTDGNTYPSIGSSASDFIEATANTGYVVNQQVRRLFYDINKNYISGLSGTQTLAFITPENTAYIRLSIPRSVLNSMQLELGNKSTPYEEFSFSIRGLNTNAREVIEARKDGDGVVHENLYKRLLDLEDKMMKSTVGKTRIYQELVQNAVAANTETILLDTTSPCAIDSLVFSTNNALDGQIRILAIKNGIPTPISLISSDGSTVQPFTPSLINQYATGIFDTLVYDVTSNLYKFNLKESMYFPEGVKITLKNRNATNTIKLGAVVMGRGF